MSSVCLPQNPAVAYLFSLDLVPYMPSNVNSILALIFCFSGFTDAIAASSNNSEATGRIAEARDSWLAAFKSKDVGAAVSFYASDAAFLQPSGDRVEGIEAIRELYQKVVSTFDTNLVVRSHNLEVAAGLAYDSGEYEETLTNRATGQKQHFRGQYLMIFRLSRNGHWKIIQHAWTVVPNPV
jgi:ketosteroid isomerase-like protein